MCHTLYDGHNLHLKEISSNFLRVLISPPIHDPHFQNIPISSMVALNISAQSKIITLGIVEGQLSTHFMITVFYDLIFSIVPEAKIFIFKIFLKLNFFFFENAKLQTNGSLIFDCSLY